MDFRFSAGLPRADDAARGLHRIRIDVKKSTSQRDFNPASGTREIPFTIVPDAGFQTVESLIQEPRTREFRFQVGPPPAK
jgi:hypothetical protein